MTSQIGSNIAIPYAAPWVANWNKFSTQIVFGSTTSTTSSSVVVPAEQWWRLVWASTLAETSASVGNRAMEFDFANSQLGGTILIVVAPAAVPASALTNMAIYPGATGYANMTVLHNSGQQLGCPDMLWPPASVFSWTLRAALAGDSLGTSTFAVEIYTESVNADTGDTVLIPSPVLT